MSEYKYIHMEEIDNNGGKTKRFKVMTNKDESILLGGVKWNGAWRQYCFYPEGECVFSTGCMLDIIDFIIKLK